MFFLSYLFDKAKRCLIC